MFSYLPPRPSTSLKFQSSSMTNNLHSVVLLSIFHRLLCRKKTKAFFINTYISNVLVKQAFSQAPHHHTISQTPASSEGRVWRH